MAIVYFPLTGSIVAVVADSSSDDDGTPQEQPVSSTVLLTPSVSEVLFEGKVTRLEPITLRTEEDGQLKTIDGNAPELAANCFGLDEFSYRVDFSHVTYGGKRDQKIQSFRFAAPTDSTPVDLATVERIALRL